MELPQPTQKDLLGRKNWHIFIIWGVLTLGLLAVLFEIMADLEFDRHSNGEGIHWLLILPITTYLVVMAVLLIYIHHLNAVRNRLLADRLYKAGHRTQECERLSTDLEHYAKQLFDKDLELTLANRRLQQLEQAKSKFVSVTTHQLRTPLAAIKWTFHMLMKGRLGTVTDEQKEFLTKGFKSTERMIAIVNDLLNVDYIEADIASYNFKNTNLAELISGVIFEFTNRATSRGVGLKFLQPAASLPDACIDPVKISMVLENLIDNALKYTKTGGKVTIYLKDDRLNTARSSLEVVVTDTGVGIPGSERDKIFHRFFRASNAIKVHTDGSGLGLFIAKDIINRHGGEIWFESKEGEGTAFHFTLPINKQ